MRRDLAKLGFCAFLSVAAFGQGFPVISKKAVIVKRLLPASVNLNKKHILVEASLEPSVTEQGAKNLPSLLKTKLVTFIQRDPRLIVEEVHPETTLRFRVTNFYTEKWTVKIGQENVEEWRGKMEVAYQAVDVNSSVTLDSEILAAQEGYEAERSSPSFENPLGARRSTGKGSENLVKDDLVDAVIRLMGRRVSPVEESFEALLPGGKLEPLSALAMSRRWGALEEQASKFDKLPKGLDDTYRQYLVALAKEAQAYDMAREANEREMGKRPEIPEAEARAQFKQAQKFMDEARAIYKDIVDANPREKGFRPGDTRTEEAIKIYAGIETNWEQQRARAAAPAGPPSGAGAAAGTGANDPSVPAGKVMTPLDRVLSFCKMGVDGAGISDYVNSPEFLSDATKSSYHFVFATDLPALNESCKGTASQLAKVMRERLDPSLVPAASVSTAPVSAAPPVQKPTPAPKAVPRAAPKAAPKPDPNAPPAAVTPTPVKQ